jgi:hypothetical protein
VKEPSARVSGSGRIADPGVYATPLVGRTGELVQAHRLLAAACGGTGGLLVLRGEAGIGKSRLVRELLRTAADRGFAVRNAEASALDQTRPFGACADALTVTVRSSNAGQAELARRIHGHLGWSGRIEDIPVEVHRLVDDLIGVFESLCTATPLLLVIDNLHWLDNSSLLLLRRLATICHQYPALIVLTTRPSDRPELAATILATQHAGGAVIELGPLESASVLSLATDVTGGQPGPRLAERLIRAAGNPLFVVELLAALLREGKISVGPGGVAEMEANVPTASLAVSILHRLALLPAQAVELLRLAAVCGQEVDPAELSLLSGGDSLAVGTALRAAEQAGLLEVRDGHLRFRHELVHDTLYNDWPKPVVRSLHRDLGTRLAADGAPAWRVAHHLSLGAAEGDMLAVDWLHRAGLEAAPRDPFAAVALLERAMDLVPPNAPERDTIRADLSVALVWAGRADEAGKLAASVIAESLDAEIRGRTAWWLASTLILRGRPRGEPGLRPGTAFRRRLGDGGPDACDHGGNRRDGQRGGRRWTATAARPACNCSRRRRPDRASDLPSRPGRGRGQRRAA